jgi:hypothetical protein
VVAGDDLGIAIAPAESEQVVGQGLGQEAERIIVHHAGRAVAFRHLGAVSPMDQRHVRVDRLGPAHGLDDAELAKGVVEVIVAADDV